MLWAMRQDVRVLLDTPEMRSSSVFQYKVGSQSFILVEKKISMLIVLVYPAEHVPSVPVTPCVPSPCGANAICREQNGAGSCSCLPDYLGDPYEGCRPECLVNSDCPLNKACVNTKCKDPCPGTCGPNAECRTVTHTPSCTCLPGYSGDPFRYCSPIPVQPGKIFSLESIPAWDGDFSSRSILEFFISKCKSRYDITILKVLGQNYPSFELEKSPIICVHEFCPKVHVRDD